MDEEDNTLEIDDIGRRLKFDETVLDIFRKYALFLIKEGSADSAKIRSGIYLGIAKKHLGSGFYDNTDRSIVFVSSDVNIWPMFKKRRFTESQYELVANGVFTEDDYREYDRIRNHSLKDQIWKKEVMFSCARGTEGVPFSCPD